MTSTSNAPSKQALRKPPDLIRNICILAHVDHGKTTLADILVASNGIISKRLAGKMRYLDSRRDEQERGITMKSSSIALAAAIDGKNFMINLIDSPGHVDFSIEVSTAVRLCDGALVLVDVIEGVCPQTRAALYQVWREGLRPVLLLNKFDRLIVELQMDPLAAALHLQQILEQVNAIMSELHITNIFEKQDIQDKWKREGEATAATTATTAAEAATKEDKTNYYDEWTAGLDECDESELYFAPELNNVIFASALHGWAFTIGDFARFLSRKLKIREPLLQKTLWGDYYLDAKNKRISRGAHGRGKKNLFASMILENIWKVYEAVLIRRDEAATEKIIATLEIQLSDRERKSISSQGGGGNSAAAETSKTLLRNIFGQWLPLAETVLRVVIAHIPPPSQLTAERVERLMCPAAQRFDSLPPASKAVKEHLLACRPSPSTSDTDHGGGGSGGGHVPTIVCISKMFAVDRKSLPENKARPLTAEEMKLRREQYLEAKSVGFEENPTSTTLTVDELEQRQSDVVFLAFARIFSGTLRIGDELYIFNSGGGDLKAAESPPRTATIRQLYMLMGRDLEAVDEVAAGNVLGIGGLEDVVLRSATLSSTRDCPPLLDLHLAATPILRVALEVDNPQEMAALIGGLKLLQKADPSVEVQIQESGEHVLITTGEVHLDKCVTDLRDRFARGIEFSVSKPIVPFRETIVPAAILADEDLSKLRTTAGGGHIASTTTAQDNGIITMHTSDRSCTLRVSVRPLPPEVTTLLEDQTKLLRLIAKEDSASKTVRLSDGTLQAVQDLKRNIENAFRQEAAEGAKKFPYFHNFLKNNPQRNIAETIWSFGPRHCGANLLLNHTADYRHRRLWRTSAAATALVTDQLQELNLNDNHDHDDEADLRSSLERSLVNGFQLASQSGPLCEEPLMGVAFVVHEWTLERKTSPAENNDQDNHQPQHGSRNLGSVSGQIISTAREAFRRAMEAVRHQQRLLAAEYSCTIQVNAEALGE